MKHVSLSRRHRPLPWGKVQGCSCAECSDIRGRDNHWARTTIIGLALGVALILATDFILDGPGFLSIFGVQP